MIRTPCRFWLAFSSLLALILGSCSSDNSHRKKLTETVSPVEQPSPHNDFSAMAGKITDSIACDAQPQLNYCLYLPSGYSAQKTFSVIFIFDAHADGKLPITKYHGLAEEFGFILVGSNNSRNGIQYDSLVGIAKTMISDVSGKISIDITRRYTMGFSGGARVAGVVASSENNIAGIIGCGAAYMDESVKTRPGLFFGFAGEDDFNLLEMSKMHAYFESAGVKNYFEIFEGKHEWPDSTKMRDAFTMLTTTNPQQKEALEKKVSGNTVTTGMIKTFEAESEMQKKYIDAFSKENIFWWKNEISDLQKCGTRNADKEKLHRCRRLLAYIGVAVYSFSTNAVKNHNDADAEKLLQIYSMVDSKNTEQRFLEAILQARQGNSPRAIALLNEAIGLGFNDVSRMESEPDFQSLKGMSEYTGLVSRIKLHKP